MIADVGIYIAVADNNPTLGNPATNHLGGIASVAGVQHCYYIGINLLNATQLASQEAGNQVAEVGGVETRKVQVFGRDTLLGKQALQIGYLRRFTRAIDPFKYYEHISSFKFGFYIAALS